MALIRADAAGRSIAPRADDSKLVRLLFDDALEDVLRDQWGLRYGVSEYYKETQVVLEDDDPELPEPDDEYDLSDLEEDEEDTENGPSLFDLFSGQPRPSAQRGAEMALERLQTPPRGFLTVPDGWKERDLENFLWANWEAMDFGFDRPIYLVGKQQRLSDSTSDRVDLLAKGRSGEHIAIELKIVEARRGDYTQLTSYMGEHGVERRTRRQGAWHLGRTGLFAKGAQLSGDRTPDHPPPVQQRTLGLPHLPGRISEPDPAGTGSIPGARRVDPIGPGPLLEALR